MGVLCDFEKTVWVALLLPHFPRSTIDSIAESATLVDYQHTGVGCLLEVAHPALPKERMVCHEPMVVGAVDGLEFGFVVFLEQQQLTLECHLLGDESLPADIRQRNVEIESSEDP